MQLPAHDPPVQTVVQAAPMFVHCPLALHTCGWSPLHCFAFCAQTPTQPPLWQTVVQAAPLFVHCPLALHTCG